MLPAFLVADNKKKIFDMPGFIACGMANDKLYVLEERNLIPLPKTAKLFCLGERVPVGFNLDTKEYRVFSGYKPVAAFVPPGYTQLFNAAYQETEKARLLPLFSYAAVAWHKNRFYVSALCVDKRKIHDTSRIDKKKLYAKIKFFKKTKNRLITHLEFCALVSCCPNAINFFLGRYEGPLPVSSICNARCLGCISSQPANSCPASQERLNFTPLPEEIAQVALIHLNNGCNRIVSFGQGCEGEPLLKYKVINEAIKIIRNKTNKGTININTNASMPQAVELLCASGLDSIRVSLNSVREEFYTRYYRPRGYAFGDILESIGIAKRRKKFVSLNYLVMAGFTDEQEECSALIKFIHKLKPDMIQWRNLNYDPLRYFQAMRTGPSKKLLGIKSVITKIYETFPQLLKGYFNQPL